MYFDEIKGGMPFAALADRVVRHMEAVVRAEGLADSTPNAVVTAVRQDLSASLRSRDEAVRRLQQRIVAESQQHQLPFETTAQVTNEESSECLSADAARIAQQQLTELKEAQRVLSETLAEKADLAARLKAAHRQLECGGARNTGADVQSDMVAQTEEESSRGPPGFGRRAPPMPTRQGTIDAGVGASPMMAQPKPLHLQTDNLGQVTPLGTFSPDVGANTQRPWPR